jgi:hypothetical protein
MANIERVREDQCRKEKLINASTHVTVDSPLGRIMGADKTRQDGPSKSRSFMLWQTS